MALADASRVSLLCCINQCPAVLVTVLVCVLWDAGEGDGYWKNSSLCLIPAYSNLHVQARTVTQLGYSAVYAMEQVQPCGFLRLSWSTFKVVRQNYFTAECSF